MLKNQMPPTPVLIKDLGMLFATETSYRKRRYGLYRCSCGTEFNAQQTRIDNGYTLSCGCHQKQRTLDTKVTHGMKSHRLYKTWSNMINRTSNCKSKDYKYYGELGITVCDRWHDVTNFIEDMYPTYQEGLSIDRIDNNLGYSPENCRWTTKVVQSRNTRCLNSINTSGYRGVHCDKRYGKWVARISLVEKRHYIGTFNTALEAAIAYNGYVIANELEHTINKGI